MIDQPKSVFLVCLALVAGLLIADPALANKFTTIGGGVSGGSAQKIAILKDIALIAGIFFIFLGVASLATRSRFEGMIGMYTGKDKFELVTLVPILLIAFGGILILISQL